MINAIQQTVTSITVIGSEGTIPYLASLSDFIIRYGSPPPALPAGITRRIYIQGVSHALFNGDNIVDGGPRVWAPGDAIILAIFGTPPPLPPPPPDRNTLFTQNADYQDLLNNINTATPAQIKTYVTNNINNLADAKVLMAKILLLLALIARGA